MRKSERKERKELQASGVFVDAALTFPRGFKALSAAKSDQEAVRS